MEILHCEGQKHNAKHKKKRLTQDQLRLLEKSFDYERKLEPQRKLQLARELGLPPRQIAIWYQNKRARWKTQSLEHDYNALQLRLDTLLAEKRRLEKDVERLRQELDKAQEMLNMTCSSRVPNAHHHPHPPLVCTLSYNSCEEGGCSSLVNNNNDVNCCWESYGVVQPEGFYDCLAGVESSDDQIGVKWA